VATLYELQLLSRFHVLLSLYHTGDAIYTFTFPLLNPKCQHMSAVTTVIMRKFSHPQALHYHNCPTIDMIIKKATVRHCPTWEFIFPTINGQNGHYQRTSRVYKFVGAKAHTSHPSESGPFLYRCEPCNQVFLFKIYSLLNVRIQFRFWTCCLVAWYLFSSGTHLRWIPHISSISVGSIHSCHFPTVYFASKYLARQLTYKM
jgi:hypothetical protein